MQYRNNLWFWEDVRLYRTPYRWGKQRTNYQLTTKQIYEVLLDASLKNENQTITHIKYILNVVWKHEIQQGFLNEGRHYI